MEGEETKGQEEGRGGFGRGLSGRRGGMRGESDGLGQIGRGFGASSGGVPMGSSCAHFAVCCSCCRSDGC